MHGLLFALVLGSGVADAAEYASEPQIVTFGGRRAVFADPYRITLGQLGSPSTLGFGIELTVAPESELAIAIEAESDLAWPDPLFHSLTPLEHGDRVAYRSNLDLAADVVVHVLGNPFSMSMWGGDLGFDVVTEELGSFLLRPDQAVTLAGDSEQGAFSLPLQAPNISLADVLSFDFGVELYGSPFSSVMVAGDRLITRVDEELYIHTDDDMQSRMAVPEHEGELRLASEYVAVTRAEMGYAFGVDGFIAIEVLGYSLWDLDINLFDLPITLLSDDATVEFGAESYTHPLPWMHVPLDVIDFGDVPVRSSQVLTVPILNDGLLDLVGDVSIDGGNVFTAGPERLSAPALSDDALVVTFAPDVKGHFDATLVLRTNDPLTPEIKIPVRGSAGDPVSEGENPLAVGDEAATVYSGCACNAAPSGTGALAMAGLLGLTMGRRRR